MNYKQKLKKNNMGIASPVLVILGCVVVAAVSAYLWQSVQDNNNTEPEPFSPAEYKLEQQRIAEQGSDIIESSSQQSSSQQSEQSSQEQSTSQDATESSQASEQSSSTEQSSQASEQSSQAEQSQPEDTEDTAEENALQIDYVVEQSERVRSEYFDDAVFIGDSLTTGIQLYDAMPNATVYAGVGINLYSIFTNAIVKQGEQNITIMQALETDTATKVYTMMGANSLSGSGIEPTLAQYEVFLDEIIRLKPEATIYVQSVMPINETIFKRVYGHDTTNAMIDEANVLLSELCKEKGVNFVNVAQEFKEEDGGLSAEVTPDGLHFNSKYYVRWMDYLKSHTV